MVSGSTPKNEFISLTETGELAEYIRECGKGYELADMVLERLNELEYIKKSKKKIWNFKDIDDYDNFLINFTEIVDEIISSFILPELENVKMDYEINSDFGCRFWE